MKKFLVTFIFGLGHFLASHAQSEYLVSTTSQQAATSTVESPEKKFINDHFRYYSLCDWVPGMKFMVLPERKDMLIPVFKSAETNKEVSSGELRYKIMEYLGNETTDRGYLHFNFDCDGQQYYHEVKNVTLSQYCMKPKAGISSLAYLGDVDIAKELLLGDTLYMRTNKVRIDDPNSTSGYKEVPIAMNERVFVTAIGVGSRAYPVKIVFADAKGNTYYQPVAISKTNCGMIDDDFIMENKNKYFPNAFSFSDANTKKSENLMGTYGDKTIYFKAEKECQDEAGTTVTLPRYTHFTIKNIISQNGTPYVIMELVALDGKIYKVKTTFTHTSVVNSLLQNEDYFTDVFGIGNLRAKYPDTTEDDWSMISRGEVRKGMTTDQCRLSIGDPIRVHKVMGKYETWFYDRKTLDFTDKKLERIN
ncbi:hypothetical protein [Phocaeicola sp.]